MLAKRLEEAQPLRKENVSVGPGGGGVTVGADVGSNTLAFETVQQ